MDKKAEEKKCSCFSALLGPSHVWHANPKPWLSPTSQPECSMWHFLRFLLTHRYCQKYHVRLRTKLHRHRNIYYKTFVFRGGYWAPGERGFYGPDFPVKDYAVSQNVCWASLAKPFSLHIWCLLSFVCLLGFIAVSVISGDYMTQRD